MRKIRPKKRKLIVLNLITFFEDVPISGLISITPIGQDNACKIKYHYYFNLTQI
jgi:hypothetical protein